MVAMPAASRPARHAGTLLMSLMVALLTVYLAASFSSVTSTTFRFLRSLPLPPNSISAAATFAELSEPSLGPIGSVSAQPAIWGTGSATATTLPPLCAPRPTPTGALESPRPIEAPFLEGDYLAAYADVRAHVHAGTFESGRQHWLSHGIAEGRAGVYRAPPVVVRDDADLSPYLTPGSAPDAAAASRVRSAQAVLDCWGRGAWETVHNGSAYEWVPERGCASALPALTPSSWCAAHAGVRLLLVGDSITLQTYQGMVASAQAAGVHIERTRWDIFCDDPRVLGGYGFRHAGCAAFSACGGATQAAHLVSDFLDLTVRERHFLPQMGRLNPLGNLLDCLAPTHIVLNRGAHYGTDTPYLVGLDRAVAVLRRAAPGVQLLLRNTPHGHVGCENATQPWASLPPNYSAYLDALPFNWGRIARQNALMRRFAAEVGLPLLDYAGPAALRPDHHSAPGDCLHYGGPSPPQLTYARLNAGAIWLLRGGGLES